MHHAAAKAEKPRHCHVSARRRRAWSGSDTLLPAGPAAGLQDLMRVLTEYEEGGGPKQDILEADDDEGEEMEVDGSGVGGAGEGAGESESECDGPHVCLAPYASRPRRCHACLSPLACIGCGRSECVSCEVGGLQGLTVSVLRGRRGWQRFRG